MTQPGKIIVLEGTDGSGKETQTKALCRALTQMGLPVRQISFPRYQDEASVLIRRYLNGDYGDDPNSVDPYTASLFYMADRADAFLGELGTFYRSGGILVTDRFTTSNMVHQASKIGDEPAREAFLNWLTDTEYQKLQIPEPDLVFFLDMPAAASAKLITERGQKKDIHETHPDYLSKSAQTGRALADKYGWTRINCMKGSTLKTIEDIHAEILSHTTTFMGITHV